MTPDISHCPVCGGTRFRVDAWGQRGPHDPRVFMTACLTCPRYVAERQVEPDGTAVVHVYDWSNEYPVVTAPRLTQLALL